MEFPRLVFKDKGMALRHGGTYSSLLVEDSKEYDKAISEGWYGGLLEAIEAKGNPSEGLVLPVDNAPVTRAEMEIKAKELGIWYHPSIGDKMLLKKIDEKLKG